ncbi:Hypothetical_protein [Hexamita inflata]|uniref:Hypothetical_protein n=1 Tax=Hexamita inflata TaxID=28002 RepID=A0AA86QQF5_9EUKA|nr:Hypothetical protein HINF_LOCUS48717 [Hexamita inflata]
MVVVSVFNVCKQHRKEIRVEPVHKEAGVDPEPPPDAAPGEQRAPAADEEPADPPAGHRGRPDGEVREAEDGAGPESDDETIFMTYLNAKLKLQLPEVPVVHLNNCVLFQLEYGFESVEKTNAVLAEVFQSFGAQHHLMLLRASRKATSWVCYRESGTKADLFPHVQFVLLCLFQLLQKHEHVGVKLAVGDVRGVTLCYEDVHCDVVGEAAAELQDFHSSAGKVKVSKKFWEWYRQHEAGSAGNQAIKFQKRFIDYGVQVEMWK